MLHFLALTQKNKLQELKMVIISLIKTPIEIPSVNLSQKILSPLFRIMERYLMIELALLEIYIFRL